MVGKSFHRKTMGKVGRRMRGWVGEGCLVLGVVRRVLGGGVRGGVCGEGEGGVWEGEQGVGGAS